MDTCTASLAQIELKDYPDILDVKQVGAILMVSTKTVYKLIKSNSISYLKVGREIRIPKINVIKYVISGCTQPVKA